MTPHLPKAAAWCEQERCRTPAAVALREEELAKHLQISSRKKTKQKNTHKNNKALTTKTGKIKTGAREAPADEAPGG